MGSVFEGYEEFLSEAIPALQETYRVPGVAVGLVIEGEVALTQCGGFEDAVTQQPVDLDTAFDVGSIAKTVTACGVMKLVEEGEIDLDHPVSTYLSRWQLPDTGFDNTGVTMRRLLSHTAGLSLHGYPGFPLE